MRVVARPLLNRFDLRVALCAGAACALACSSEEPSSDSVQVGHDEDALSAITLRTYGFESLSDWSAIWSSPTLSLSSTRVQGSWSLSVAGGGWSTFRSRDLTKEDPAPTSAGFDLRIPTNQPNPGWFGTVLLFVSIPSQGIFEQQLGHHDLIAWTPGQWKRAEFTLPANVSAALEAEFSDDLHWRIELNRPGDATGGYLFDRFTIGDLCANVTCAATDSCHEAGTCDPATGLCSNPAKPNGSACDDDNPCTQIDTCQSGTCTGGSPVVCTASDQCHDPGTCDPETGVCSNPPKANGAACSDGSVCTEGDTCQAGTCTPGASIALDDGNPCTADMCHPVNGVSHANLPAGASCTLAGGMPGLCDGSGTCDPRVPGDCNLDGARDSTEECDDGPGSEPDLCSASCRVTDALAVRGPAGGRSRWLGESRHPIAAGAHGFGVAFVEPDSEPPVVGLSVFDSAGDPRARIDVSSGSTPVLFSNPAVAALQDGSYAIAWTDFGRDGDGLGVALRRVRPAAAPGNSPPTSGLDLGAELSTLQFANTAREFSQYDAELIRAGSHLVVAWTDTTDAFTAPDLRYRTFEVGSAGSQAMFQAVGPEEILAASEAYEGNVALAPFGEAWVAAWRESRDDAEETIVVSHPSRGLTWSLGPHPAGNPEDRPAVAELDGEHLAVLFSVGTDPDGSDVTNVPRLRLAILSLTEREPIAELDFLPVDDAYADPAVAQSHPSLVRAGDILYAAWRAGSLFGDPQAENVFLRELGWDGEITAAPEVPIPRSSSGSGSDQRVPALAIGPARSGTPGLPDPAPQGALVVAWDDYSREFGMSQGRPDVVVQHWPLPLLRFEEISQAADFALHAADVP